MVKYITKSIIYLYIIITCIFFLLSYCIEYKSLIKILYGNNTELSHNIALNTIKGFATNGQTESVGLL